MAADVALEGEPPNPCCAEIKKRYQKLEEKRNALRQAVKLLENQTNKLLNENQNLKKAYEEERVRAEQEKEAKEKESTVRNQLEREVHDLKVELSSHQKSGSLRSENGDESGLIRILDAEGEVERLKELLEKEKKRNNSEKKKAEVEKKKAAEAWKLIKVEKSKAEEEKRHAEIERNKADEYRRCLEKLKMEANETREKLIAEISKTVDANRMVEAEKQKIIRERKRADLERTKAEEQRRLMEVERKKVMDEKDRADNLSQRLEEEKQRSEELQRKDGEILSAGRERRVCSCFGDERHNGGTNIKTADVKLLREQLKLKKKEVKHAKRMNKLEKVENRFIRKELHLLKQNFMQMSCHFNVLHDFLSRSVEGTDNLAKNAESPGLWGCNLQNNLLGSKPCNFNSQSDFELPEMCYINSLDHPSSARECSRHQLSRRSCTRPTPGISSELEPPVGGSVRIKSKSSAVCSPTTSFSDSKFMGSQGKDAFFATASTEVAENVNKRSSLLKLCSGVAKTRQTENFGLVAENNNLASVQGNGTNACLNSSAVSVKDQASTDCRKKRRIQDTLESVAWLYSEDDRLHLKIGERLSELKNLLSRKASVSAGSINSGITGHLDDRTRFYAQNHNDISRKSCKHSSDKMLHKLPKPDVQYLNQNDIQKQADKIEAEDGRVSCLLPEMAKPFQMKENTVCIEEQSNAVSSKRADLISFEKMICGDYMKILDLDNDADERRYKAAIEMPLSPTLPEIGFASLQLSVQDDSHFLVEGTSEIFETERSNSLPLHTFDVIDLEISSNNTKQRAPHFQDLSLNDNPVLSHSTEEVRINGAVKSDSVFKQHDILCNVGNPSFHGNDSNRDVEPTHNGCNTGDSVQKASNALPLIELKGQWGFKSLVHDLLGPNAISDPKVSVDAVSGASDKPLLSGSTSCGFSKFTLHSEQLCDSGYIQNSTSEMHNLSREVVYVPNGTHATAATTLENQVKGKGEMHDGTVVLQSGEMLDKNFEAEKSDQIGTSLVSEYAGMKEASKPEKISGLCRGNAGFELGKIPKHCVVFSNMDVCSITRIVHYMNTVTSQGCIDTQVLHAIAAETELLPKEKAVILFSLLLYNISGIPSANSRCIKSGEFLQPSYSFTEEINKVISNGEARWLILEICQLNILVNLIEDFLINRRVLLYADKLLEPLSACFSSEKFHHLNGSDLCVATRSATVDQIIAGCVIFASISATVDCIDIVLEASYRILRMCKNDISWILLAVHVFASVCGKKFFNLDDYKFLVNTIRLVVSLVERGHEYAFSSSSCLDSTQHMLIFPSCQQCPFSTDELCMDSFACLLLDELQGYVLAGNINNLDGKKTTALNCTAQSCSQIDERGTDCKTKATGLKIECDRSCSIYKSGKLTADRSVCFPESNFCYFTDIISLVELIGCYMRWEWTYNKVVSRLVNILEFCISEEFSAALFVLVGQLGRFGVDEGGYQQIEVAELRCSLSRILDAGVTGKKGIPTQFSAVGALLNLLPFKFEEIVGHLELSPDDSEYGYVTQVKKWFSQLSREQQAMSFDLFR